jgi:hypothetical protein
MVYFELSAIRHIRPDSLAFGLKLCEMVKLLKQLEVQSMIHLRESGV